MTDFLRDLLRVATIVFTVSSMLSVGFSYTAREVLGPLKNVKIVLRVLAANFLLVPLLALLLARVLPLDPPIALGLFLLATAGGAPFLIKLLDKAKGDVGRGATMLVLLTPASVVYMPLVVPWALEHPALSGLSQGQVSAWAIGRPLAVTIILPLVVGLLVKSRAPAWAERLQPSMGRTASVSLFVLLACAVLTNLGGIVDLLGFPLLAVVLLFVGAFAIGYVIAGPDPERRVVLGLGTGQRGIAAATIVATQAIGDPDCTTMVVAGSLVGLLALFPIAGSLGKRKALPIPAGEGRWDERFGAPVRT